jgi:hypothetical protein
VALQIKTTGYEDYLDESGNIRVLVIGGPGAGKTRSSSFWPKPFYLDCEDGRQSIADRRVPYVEIRSSKDMLDGLEYLKSLERTPKKERKYQTVVVDTLDSFQRKVKDEWLQQTGASNFKGFEAWGYLDSKMQMLLTRLLNLDYNVIVLVHYKTKTNKDAEGNESHELVLQLQGDTQNTTFNDFALVGWLGTYWDLDKETGERVEKRGLTFHKTPEKAFLKDRFHLGNKWWPITFSDTDYTQLYDALLSKLDERDLQDAEVVGEVPDSVESTVAKTASVVGPLAGGPVEARPVGPKPLESMTKQELLDVAAEEKIQVKGNALKAELVTAIKKARDAAPASASPAGATGVPGFPSTYPKAPVKTPEPPVSPETSVPDAPAEPTPEPDPEPTVEAVAEQLNATVISDEVVAETPPTPVTPPAAAAADFMAGTCDEPGCGKPLQDQTRDYVRLSFIKFRRGYLCDDHYAAARTAGR